LNLIVFDVEDGFLPLNFIVNAPFLAHMAFGQVSFCHHLASVVRRNLSHLNFLLGNP
jgi:hypothetical protein